MTILECYAEFSPHIPFLNGPTDVWALGGKLMPFIRSAVGEIAEQLSGQP